MTTNSHPSLKRFALVGSVISALIGGALISATPQAVAATGNLTYTCAIQQQSGTSTPVLINAGVNGSTTAPSGSQLQRSVVSHITFNSAFIQGLRSQGGFTAMEGTAGTSHVTTNGAATPVSQTFAKKDLPTSGGLTVVASGALDPISPADGTVTYKPGAVELTLAMSGGFGVNLNLSCPLPSGGASKVIGTVQVGNTPPPATKAASRIGTGVAYVKKTKKLTVAGKVVPTPAQVATGNMNFKLYKAGKRIRNVTVPLKAGLGKTTLSGKIGKGTYTLLITYYGSPKVKASTATRTFKLK